VLATTLDDADEKDDDDALPLHDSRSPSDQRAEDDQ
jgi:hypothetical protein